jgi:hypothetical protein
MMFGPTATGAGRPSIEGTCLRRINPLTTARLSSVERNGEGEKRRGPAEGRCQSATVVASVLQLARSNVSILA